MPEKPHDDDPNRTAAHTPRSDPANDTRDQSESTFPPEVRAFLAKIGHDSRGSKHGSAPTPGGSTRGADGVTVPGYTISAELGRGGMGVVYHARQEGLNRPVALKMILGDGPVAGGELFRFLAEAEAVAAVRHPNVVQVYESGEHDGRPFLVLEFCPGGSLADRLRAARQKARPGRWPFRSADAAELVRKMAEGVAAAHDLGIVHRDLKPGNILFDAGGEPKVSDFGLAKRGQQDLTRTDAVMGTPAYMSPEQAKGASKFVGPQADVWALGVILYECLSGKRPFDADSALAVMRRVADDQPDPLRAAVRDVPRDLELICLKCLAKEPHERYPTGRELADDLGRFLDGQPVLARPAGPVERLVKWAKRNPGYAALWGGLGLALVAGTVVSATFAARAERARAAEADRAESERQARLDAAEAAEAERKAKVAAEEATRIAGTRLLQTEKAYDVLAGVFTDLHLTRGLDEQEHLTVMLRDRLEHAATQLDAAAVGDPLTAARMQTDIANALLSLGSPGRAAELAEKALATRRDRLGPDNPDTLVTLTTLAMAHQTAERPDLAIPLHQEALTRRTAVLGPDARETIASTANLGSAYVQAGRFDLAVPRLEEAWKRIKDRFGPDDAGSLNVLNNLAVGYQKLGSTDRAVALLEGAVARLRAGFPADLPLTLTVESNLAAAHQYAGRPDRAIPIFEMVLAAQSDTLGRDHFSTLKTRAGLASALLGVKQTERATALLEEALPLLQARLGNDHSTTVIAMSNLGAAYKQAGRLDLAVPLMERVRDAWVARYTADHPDALTAVANLGGAYYEAGHLDKAIAAYKTALDGRVKVLSWDHPATQHVAGNLGFMYEQAGRFADAAGVYSDRLIAVRRRFPAGDPNLLGPLVYLGNAQLRAGQYAEAAATLREALTLGEQFAPAQWGTVRLRSLLGAALLGQGKTEEAGPLVTAGYEGMSEHAKRLSPPARRERLVEALAPLVRYHELAGNAGEAARRRAELEALLPAVAPPPRPVKGR